MKTAHPLNCLLWTGTFATNATRTPVRWEGGKQVSVARERWQRAYGVALPKGVYLGRVCATANCTAPWHHTLKNPQGVARKRRASPELLRTLRHLIRRKVERRPETPIRWDVQEVASLECYPAVVEALAYAADTGALEVLCAYAQLVKVSQGAVAAA